MNWPYGCPKVLVYRTSLYNVRNLLYGTMFFLCVHGKKMSPGEVIFLAAIAWVKGGRDNFFLHIEKAFFKNFFDDVFLTF